MNDDLISRQAAINALEELKELDYELYIRTSYSRLMEDQWDFVIKRYKEAIKETPSVQPKAGHWRDTITAGINETVCSVCLYNGFHHFNYCPYCGAKMKEIDSDEQLLSQHALRRLR